jgi:hypothetical protein
VFVSLSPAAEDGGPGVASAPGQPQSGFRGVVPMQDRDDFLSFFNSIPTHSFQPQQIRPFLTRRLACQGVAFGEDWSRHSAKRDGGTPPGGSLQRAQKRLFHNKLRIVYRYAFYAHVRSCEPAFSRLCSSWICEAIHDREDQRRSA